MRGSKGPRTQACRRTPTLRQRVRSRAAFLRGLQAAERALAQARALARARRAPCCAAARFRASYRPSCAAAAPDGRQPRGEQRRVLDVRPQAGAGGRAPRARERHAGAQRAAAQCAAAAQPRLAAARLPPRSRALHRQRRRKPRYGRRAPRRARCEPRGRGPAEGGARQNKRTLRIQQLLAHSLVHLSLFFWSSARAMPRIARQCFARDPPMSHVGLGEALGARASRRAGSRPSVHPSPRRSRPAPVQSAAAARAGRRLSRAPVPFGWAPDEPTSRRERRVARRGRAPLPAGPLRLHSCSEDETSTIWIRRLATEPGPHARAVSSFPPLGSMWPRGRQAVAQLREPKP